MYLFLSTQFSEFGKHMWVTSILETGSPLSVFRQFHPQQPFQPSGSGSALVAFHHYGNFEKWALALSTALSWAASLLSLVPSPGCHVAQISLE